MNRHLLPIAHELDWTRAHRPQIRTFSRWRWIFRCACGLRHRRGEDFFEVRQGTAPRWVSRCTRCGAGEPGRVRL